MSVDRLSYADLVVLCAIHDCEAILRPSVNRFYGWYEFIAESARVAGMSLAYAPTDDNDWHSEVKLPLGALDDSDSLLEYCTKLASESEWRARPMDRTLQQDIEEASAGIEC